MLTWQKKFSIMNNFPLSGYTALVDYEIWIGFNILQGKYNRHTSRKKKYYVKMNTFLLYRNVINIFEFVMKMVLVPNTYNLLHGI
jgi:hypothetical protein